MKPQLAVLLLVLSIVCFSHGEVSGQSLIVEGTVWKGTAKVPDANDKFQEHHYVSQAQSKVDPGDVTTAVKWTTYSSTAGRFSMLFPGQPALKEQAVDSAAGKLTNNILVASSGSSAFLASYADYPPVNEDLQAVLDRVRDGAVTGVKGTLIKSIAITHKGYPGREFQASAEGMLATFRIYLVNNRLYQMVALGPPGASTAEVKDFLNSFDLKVDK